ncbi:MAG: hypothetical protein JNM17_18520 [Archangium sp.]|nr:hypothetical protein [Archangium sp.]
MLTFLTGAVLGPRRLAEFVLGAGLPLPGETVPRQIPYRGQLERNGVPVNDSALPMRFRLLAIDGGLLYDEAAVVAVANGAFAVELADGVALDAGVWREPFVELEVSVGSPAVVLGKQRILTVPFAAHSSYSDTSSTSAFAATASVATTAGSAALLTGRRVVSYGANQYSVDGVRCGITNSSTQGAMSFGGENGVRASKLLCQSACMTLSAHMCTAEEVFMMKNLGVPVPTSDIYWIAGNFRAAYSGTYGFTDCESWTNNTAPGSPGYYGTTVENGALSVDGCNSAHAILCCD